MVITPVVAVVKASSRRVSAGCYSVCFAKGILTGILAIHTACVSTHGTAQIGTLWQGAMRVVAFVAVMSWFGTVVTRLLA